MRIYLILISITMLFGNANAKITPVTELQSGTVHIISSMLSFDDNNEGIRKSRVHQKERQLSRELHSKLFALTDTSINYQLILASNEKILDISTERDAKAKNSEYTPIEQPASDQLIDISTERDGSGQKKFIKPDDEKKSTASESPPTIIPVEGVH